MRYIALLTFITSTAGAATGGVEDMEPVNIISESGLDVGPCPSAGSLSYPPQPYKGSAYFLRQADTKLASRHDGLTQKQAPWLHRLDGPSGSNRLYTAPNGDRALVFWACKARDCDAHQAYGAYGLRSIEYSLQVQEQGKTQALGSNSATLAAAIACAREFDDRARRGAVDALKKQTTGK